MAGNIIPAIATTNAVISGLIVLQALHMLRLHLPSLKGSTVPAIPDVTSAAKPSGDIRNVYLQSGKAAVPLGSYSTCPPSPGCAVCRETYVEILCDPEQTMLGDLVDAVLSAEASGSGGDGEKREVTVYEEGRILADPDWDDNLGRTLADLKCGRGKFITLTDEDEVIGNLVLCIGLLP